MSFLFNKISNKLFYRYLLKARLKRVGKNFRFGYASEIKNPRYFSFGDNFYSGPFAYFGTNENNLVEIGDYVMFGPKCTIQGGNHNIHFEGFMFNNQEIENKIEKIIIENGVWIGSNTTIISGANIGEGSIIGAMSLVNKKIPPFVVAGGVPSKVIKPRFNSLESVEKLGSGRGSLWKYAIEVYAEGNFIEQIISMGQTGVLNRISDKVYHKVFPHNGFLQILLGNGLLGLILLLYYFKKIFDLRKRLTKEYSVLIKGLFFAFLTMSLFQNYDLLYFHILLMLAIATYVQSSFFASKITQK